MRKYQLREMVTEDDLSELQFYPELTRHLLYHRGVKTLEDAEKFLKPSYDLHTHDPFGIKDMDRSVERILGAIEGEETITIWSDYDHDGIPGGVILHDFFKKIEYPHFNNYIPHRYIEGYGLNEEGIEKLAKEGTTLIITVDSGITDVLPVAKARELNVDVIISDHHLPQEKLPEAFAILNSKQEDCNYPYDMLCGAAVAFKLVQGLIARGNFGDKISAGWEKWLLDLVGLSTVADMVPLTGENRVLAHYGLKVLRKTPRPGLLKLLRLMNIQGYNITEDDIGFMIAPRINAASRMGDPRLAFDLLTSRDEGVGETLARELQKLNDARKGVVAGMVKEMKHTLSERSDIPSVIVMGNPHWRPGLLGLAASNLVEAHSRPAFLWGREGGETLKGSCRSDGSVNVVKLMEAVPRELFIDFGGHAASGGFAITTDAVPEFEREIIRAYEKVRNEDFEEIVAIDKQLQIDDVSMQTWRAIEPLAPFGMGNEKPLFMFEQVTPEKSRMFGKKGEHLELTFRKSNGDFVRAIEFFSGRNVSDGKPLTLVANLEKSTFGRYPEVRLRIVDIL